MHKIITFTRTAVLLVAVTATSCSQKDYLKEFDTRLEQFRSSWEDVSADGTLGIGDKTARLEDLESRFREDVIGITEEGLSLHYDDSVALGLIFRAQYMELESPERILAHIDRLGASVREHPDIVKLHEMLSKSLSSAPGESFIDFAADTPAGASARLSDYAGKGKWCLVDFWASWCGPCRREIENLKNIYKEFAPKGLVMVSVAVWDKKEDSIAAAEELGIQWHQMVGAGEVPTDLYGINGIPHIILIDPDGRISSRGLRGDGLAREISGIFQ